MRADIEKYLGTVQQSTAKTIADRIGLPQLEVNKELNHMTNDGVVERAKRQGGGNEYEYWLASSEPIKPVASAPGAAAPSVPVPPVKPESPDTEGFAKLSKQTTELLEVLGLPPYMSQAAESARTMVEIAQRTAVERDELRVENESLKSTNTRLRENTVALERSIDDLTGVASVQLPKVYFTIGRTAKPKRHGDLPRAQKRAAALVRTEQESEVLVLAPVGRMVRGTEWKNR